MKKPWRILIAVEVLLSIGVAMVGSVNRSETAHAFFAWRQNPSPEMRQAFEREKRVDRFVRWSLGGVLFSVLAGVTFAAYGLRRGERGASLEPLAPGSSSTHLHRSKDIN